MSTRAGATGVSTCSGCTSLLNDFELKKNQILERVGIVDLIAEHVSLKRSGRRWLGLCPFHTEKTPSFTVNPDLGIFKCFGCGKAGDIFTFIQERERLTFMEAMQYLADRAGIELKRSPQQADGTISRNDLVKVSHWAMTFFQSVLRHDELGKKTREYLRTRGVSDDMVRCFNLGLSTEGMPSLTQSARKAGFSEHHLVEADLCRRSEDGRLYDTFRERLIFPIRDVSNRVLGFGGRTLVDDRAKYLNTRQNLVFDKGRGLYGIDLAREAMIAQKRAILVEGYTDCIASHQAGFQEAVATLGTALTEAQVDLVRRYCEELILLFDSDEAGEAAADRAIQVALPRYLTVRLARIPEGKDPSEFLASHSAEAFSKVLKDAVDALEFKWHRTRSRYHGLSSDVQRREALLAFVRLVVEASSTGAMDAIQRGLVVNRIAALVGADTRDIHDLVVREQRKSNRPAATTAARPAGQATSPPRDGGQAAWADLLGVLLNEPGLLSLVDPIPAVDSIADPLDRRIAGVVFTLIAEWGEIQARNVLARCDEPDQARRVTELVERGATRGNYEETLMVALSRIRLSRRIQEFESARQEAVSTFPAGDAEEGQTNALRAVHGCLKELRHFAPRRLVRRQSGPAVPPPSGQGREAS